jgi:hypothetical protein
LPLTPAMSSSSLAGWRQRPGGCAGGTADRGYSIAVDPAIFRWERPSIWPPPGRCPSSRLPGWFMPRIRAAPFVVRRGPTCSGAMAARPACMPAR